MESYNAVGTHKVVELGVVSQVTLGFGSTFLEPSRPAPYLDSPK